jgi:hypothetical protein
MLYLFPEQDIMEIRIHVNKTCLMQNENLLKNVRDSFHNCL